VIVKGRRDAFCNGEPRRTDPGKNSRIGERIHFVVSLVPMAGIPIARDKPLLTDKVGSQAFLIGDRYRRRERVRLFGLVGSFMKHEAYHKEPSGRIQRERDEQLVR
jgi:hypothetical protein